MADDPVSTPGGQIPLGGDGGNKSHVPVNIEDEMRKSYLDYAMSVIIGRALPDVRDGLKPVHRRILFGMSELGLNYNRPTKKCAKIVGETMGNYHPHGDQAIYPTLVHMAQSWAMREMLIEQQDVFYYITVMNENHAQADVPASVHADLLKGCYRFAPAPAQLKPKAPTVTLMGSGAILGEVIKAAALLADEGIAAEVLSVTSWSELARDGMACEKEAMEGGAVTTPFIHAMLANGQGPVIAATDYVRSVPESIRAFVPTGRRYLTLGTDGFGRSDTRQELRAFFQVDAASIVKATKFALNTQA